MELSVEREDEEGKKQLALWEELWNDLVPGQLNITKLVICQILILFFLKSGTNFLYLKMYLLGTHSAVRLYKKELLEVVFKTMRENPVWARKAQAAAMLSRIIESQCTDYSPAEAG